jgi:2-keto-4-pentenoate hydratase/2-oxohepta-3-ene-1,7-dioic acid hydratase in catechol pathway
MRFARYSLSGKTGLAAARAGEPFRGLLSDDAKFPGELHDLLSRGDSALRAAAETLLLASVLDMEMVKPLPPLPNPGKIICIGLNYVDHAAETGLKQPDYPIVFTRFPSTLIGDGAAIERPKISEQLDYEGEFVAVIGKSGKHIPKTEALDHIAGYSLFNDVSVRDYQRRTGQWTVGKNFDASGPFGPYFATADEFPPGCSDLRIQTRLNGVTVQDANTRDLVFDVVTLVSTLSEAFRLEVGDIIVTGTCGGVGGARKPPLWMKPGDQVEVELEGFGILRNTIVQEAKSPS